MKAGAKRMEREILLSGGGFALRLVHDEMSGFKVAFLGPKAAVTSDTTIPTPVFPAGPDVPGGPQLIPQRGEGYSGAGHLDAVSMSNGRAVQLKPQRMYKSGTGQVTLVSGDEDLGLEAEQEISLKQGVVQFRTRLRSVGGHSILLIHCAAALFPLPDWAEEIVTGYGAWAREGHESRRRIEAGFVGKVSRLGRTGFDGLAGAIVCEASTTNRSGKALGVQLAWSGSHRIQVERLRDGACELVAEALYEPGEIILAAGDEFETPQALLAISDQGADGLTRIWHNYARVIAPGVCRPVHFNTWEARYFQLTESSLMELASESAKLGAERFILDDGWFAGRRDDTSSLGDWWPDSERFPDGLQPLISAVHGLGMSFGLWVEPEMVSRKSNLYRAHPEWVLGYPDNAAPTGRNQLVLDLSNPDVRDHLFGMLSTLLQPGGIDYLKWDCNRELYPATVNGRMRADAQVKGVYDLMDRLRSTFPELEIESCASGGGRIDFGILPRVMRFWPSDATDAEDRIRIQDHVSRCIPMEYIGSHIGPAPNPVTGRSFPMAFRGLVALFGHLGVELDPIKLAGDDHDMLVRVIALYKRYRNLMQGGTYQVLSSNEPGIHTSMITSADQKEFLLRTLRTQMSPYPMHARTVIADLPNGNSYHVREIILGSDEDRDLGIFSADSLRWNGLQADPGTPCQGRLFHFEKAV